HPDHHRARPAVRPAARRRHHHRDGVRVAGRGHAHGRLHPQPGLPGRAVRGRAAGADHRVDQLPRGHHRGVHRPPHPGGRVTTASADGTVTLHAAESPAPRRDAGRIAARRLWRLKWGLVAAVIMVMIVGAAVLAPWIAPYDPVIVDI